MRRARFSIFMRLHFRLHFVNLARVTLEGTGWRKTIKIFRLSTCSL